MVEDYNTVAKFKSDIIANLNEYENMWSSHYPDYKPFISCGRSDSADENLEDFLDLNVQDNRKIADQYPFIQKNITKIKGHLQLIVKNLTVNIN